MTSGLSILVSEEKISEAISSFFDYKIDIPTISLIFHPYWFFDIHIGLEKHFGILNALNSEVLVDVKEFENATNMKVVEIEQIEEVKTFLKEEIQEPKIRDAKDAEKIANYKIKYLFPNKEFFLANFNMLCVPMWLANVKEKKYIVSGIDENFKKKLLEDLQKDFQKVKTHSEIFEESLKGLKRPHTLLIDFWKVLKTNNKLTILIILILIILVVIFIIKKIALKI